MEVKELKDVMIHFKDRKYDNYRVVFWDASRQTSMDATYTGLSHPDKEISFNVWDKKNPRTFKRIQGDQTGLIDKLPSPFKKGEFAELHKEENYDCLGVKITRYFYKDPSGHQFTTAASDTYTMCEYYREKMKQYRKLLKENGIKWE